MSVTDILGMTAAAFGVGMGASPLLQARRAHRRRSSEDVSLAFLVTLCAGGFAWLSYGIALGNAALIVANAVGIAGSATAIAVTLRFRREEARSRAVALASAGGHQPPASAVDLRAPG